jgi:ABC-type multidrug transport system fused ATPase/permease subunit
MMSVSRVTGVHDFATKLPQGYETILGKNFGDELTSVDLSGGQWQRLALARTLFASGSVFVFDEPSAFLDVKVEMLLTNHLERLSKNHTCILISHRLSTVQRADNIAVIQSGKVIEIGTHEELLNIKGVYNKLFAKESGFSDRTDYQNNSAPLNSARI